MHIIPVIDLKDGLVVAARQGNRRTYKPLASPLCPKPDLPAVIRAYLSVFPFRIFYIADLNAIEKTGNNHALISRMLETNQRLSVWIDSGTDLFANDSTASPGTRASNVLGSETGITMDQLGHYTRKSDCILSLDYRGGRLLGNPDLPAQPDRLPQRIIIMSLDRVGSHYGPDFEHIRPLAGRLPGKQVYTGGGVRNAEDLRRLAALGVRGALVATALHDKTITSEHLQQCNMDVQDVN